MIRLNVNFNDNSKVKKLGAKWNSKGGYWYIPDNLDYHLFQDWISQEDWELLENVIELPFMDLLRHISDNVRILPIRYCVEGDVINEYDTLQGDRVIHLIDNQQTKNELPVFIAQKDLPPLKDTRIKLTGRLQLYKNGKFQLCAEEGHSVELCSRLQRISQWEADCFEYLVDKGNTSKYIPKFDFSSGLKIAVITAKNAEGYKDFEVKINKRLQEKNGRLDCIEIELSPDNINKTLIELQSKDYDCICLIRGGGSKEQLLSFSHPTLLEAMYNSKIPIITGVGHASDELLCKRVKGTYNADTPTGAAEFLNKEYYKTISQDKRDMLKEYKAECERLESENQLLQRTLSSTRYEMDKLQQYIESLHTKMAEMLHENQTKKSFWQRLFK